MARESSKGKGLALLACPVAALALECGAVLLALDRVQAQQFAMAANDVAAAVKLRQQEHELHDLRDSIEDRAALLLAQTASGAAFQIALVVDAVSALADYERALSRHERNALARRSVRCLFSVLKFLDWRRELDQRMERAMSSYAPPYIDPFAAREAAS